jgi:transcriptional regulator with XRE-family HTH domain
VVNSVLARRRLAQGLRRYRHRADRSLEDVADALTCSAAKISRLENGISSVRLTDLRAIASYLGLPPAERAELEDLVRSARAREWWQEFSDVVPPQSATVYGLEDGAAAIQAHAMALVPGLLQTEAYARALIWAVPGVSSDVRDRRLGLRMRRRQLLDRPDPPQFTIMMDEAVLHREIGGPEVTAAQWEHVLRRAQDGVVVVRVIPRQAPAHRAEGVGFSLFDFEHEDLAPVVYLEALTQNAFVEEPAEVAVYRSALDSAGQVALSAADSLEMVAELARRSG